MGRVPGLVAIPDASFFIKAQQAGDFHEHLAQAGLRLKVVIPRPVFWELDELRFKQDQSFTVREVRRRLEQLLRTQQERGALVTYETDLEARLIREQKVDEQLVSYLAQRAKRSPRDRFVLISDNITTRNLALLSPDLQQLHNVHVSSLEAWPHAAEWLLEQADPGFVSGWAIRLAQDVMEDVGVERYQGMRVSVACDITDYAFGEASIKIWFQDAATQVWLEDRNGEFQTGGYVTLSDRISVTADRERYEHTFFLPYDELHLNPGSHQISLAANVLNPLTGRQVGESGWAEFGYRERRPEVKLHEATVQTVHPDERKDLRGAGLEISASFTVDSWRGRAGEMRVYFRDQATGEQLMDVNGRFACDGGYVCASQRFVPQREHARFRRCSVFIPRDELHLPDRKRRRVEFVVTLWAAGHRRELAESEWLEVEVGDEQPEGPEAAPST
jgi:hypothetical protein